MHHTAYVHVWHFVNEKSFVVSVSEKCYDSSVPHAPPAMASEHRTGGSLWHKSDVVLSARNIVVEDNARNLAIAFFEDPFDDHKFVGVVKSGVCPLDEARCIQM